MLVQNWPTAFVMIAFMITATIIGVTHINRNRPEAQHCIRCTKDLQEQRRREFANSEPDE